MLKPENKRRFTRVNWRSALRCQVRGDPQFDHAICDNISANGLSFTTRKFIAPSTHVMLEFDILSKVLRPIGKIAWTQPLPHTDRNRLGVEFTEFDPLEKEYLSAFIDMRTQKV
jgi:hypothetical protein